MAVDPDLEEIQPIDDASAEPQHRRSIGRADPVRQEAFGDANETRRLATVDVRGFEHAPIVTLIGTLLPAKTSQEVWGFSSRAWGFLDERSRTDAQDRGGNAMSGVRCHVMQ